MAGPAALASLVDRCPAPERVRAALASLAEAPDAVERLVADTALAARVVGVMAASRSLTRLVLADPRAIDVLAQPDRREPLAGDSGLDEVIAWRHRELLRIASVDLQGGESLEVVTESLSDAASLVLEAALRAALGDTAGPDLAVIALGKLGARELNYASDVDIVFVSEGDPVAAARVGRRVVELAGRALRVDTTLRPEGRDGPLVRTLSSYEAYWDRWAEPWERQALIKAGPVAGSEVLGRQWMSASARVVWGRPFDAEALRQVRDLKARAEAEVRRRRMTEREIKRGPGGIRDVEFAVQLLQLVHGPADAALRRRATLRALEALATGGYVDSADARHLADGYRWLRRVEHVLQLRDEQQTHAVPVERAERRRVARVLGYRGDPRQGATAHFDSDLAAVRARVRTAHERVWFRPLLAAFAGAGTLTPEAAAERLSAFGFHDVARTREAVSDLTRGLNRSSRMMQQLLPLLLDWLSGSPDPDQGLLGLRRLATGEQRSMELASAFRDSPEAARQLARMLGTSRLLGEILEANPDCIERLADPSLLRTRPPPELVESARTAVSWRTDLEERQRGLRRWTRRQLLGIAARDVLGHDDVRSVGSDLAAVAEATVQVSLESLAPAVPLAVVALGRLGGSSSVTPATWTWSSCTTASEPVRLRRRNGSLVPCCASWAGRRPPAGSGRSTTDCDPKARTAPCHAASKPGTSTWSAGPRPGSAKPTCGPGSWPATGRWAMP